MAKVINWDNDTTSGLVSVGTHSLFLRAAGPNRKAGVPVVIVEAGMGDSSLTWMAVARLVAHLYIRPVRTGEEREQFIGTKRL